MKEKLIKLGLDESMADLVVNNFGKLIDGEYIPKERFNEVNNQLKTANETIKERDDQLSKVKNDASVSEELKAKLEEQEKANKLQAKQHQEAILKERKTNAIKLELVGKVHNADIAMSQLNMDSINISDDGKVTGLTEQVDSLRKSDGYLFIEVPEPTSPKIKGATPAGGASGEPSNVSAAVKAAEAAAERAAASKGSNENDPYFQ